MGAGATGSGAVLAGPGPGAGAGADCAHAAPVVPRATDITMVKVRDPKRIPNLMGGSLPQRVCHSIRKVFLRHEVG